MTKFCISIILLLSSINSFSQNLFNERIWKIPNRKKAIYLSNGVFHNISKVKKSKLTQIRNRYVPKLGYERIVLDFSSNKVPRVYGYINTKKSKLFMDIFNVELSSNIKNLKNTKFLKNVDFYNIDTKTLSIELNQKVKVSYDIFVLENPARLVIDVKKE
jgi:hypothetical protein